MEHVRNRKWDNIHRLENIHKIVRTLQETGSTDVKYYTGRSLAREQLLGEGHLESMPEKGEWNQVIIRYKGRDAVKLFEGNRKIEGIVFDEKFNESEYTEIKNALSSSGIHTWQDELKKHTIVRYGYAFVAVCGFIFTIWGIYTGDFLWTFGYLFLGIVFLHIFLHK